MLTGILAARQLGPTGRGELAAVQTWAPLLAGVGSFGIPNAVAYYASRYSAKAGRIFSTGLLFLMAWSCVLIGIGFFLIPAVLSAQSPQVVHVARLYLLMVPMSYLAGLPLWLLAAGSHFTPWNLLRFFLPLSWLAILLVTISTNHATTQTIIVAYLVAELLLIVPACLVMLHYVRPPFRPELSQLPKLIRYGLPTTLTGIPGQLNVRLDQILIAAFLPTGVLGMYVVAVAWSSLLSPLLQALGVVSFPRLAGMPDRAEQAVLLQRVSRAAVFAGCSLALILSLVSPLGFPLLFGRQYAAAVSVAQILVIAAVFNSLNQVLEEGLRGLGVPRWPLIAELAGLPVTLLLLWLLLPHYQATGAAIASVFSYAIVTVVLLIAAHRMTGRPLKNFLLPTSDDFTMITNRVRGIRNRQVARRRASALEVGTR